MDKVLLPPERVNELLAELCVKLGFCLNSVAWTRIVNSPPRTIDRFTDVMFSEEGVDYRYQPKIRDMVREIVARYFDAKC